MYVTILFERLEIGQYCTSDNLVPALGYRSYAAEAAEQDEEAGADEISAAEEDIELDADFIAAIKQALGGGNIANINAKQYTDTLQSLHARVEEGEEIWEQIMEGTEETIKELMFVIDNEEVAVDDDDEEEIPAFPMPKWEDEEQKAFITIISNKPLSQMRYCSPAANCLFEEVESWDMRDVCCMMRENACPYGCASVAAFNRRCAVHRQIYTRSVHI